MELASTAALSRMMALRERMDITANNIANMNTTGFKAEELLLREEKKQHSANGVRPLYNQPFSMVGEWGTIRNTSAGVIKATSNPLDMAIEGEGYFVVTNPDGQDRYTRNGVFQLGADGQLVDLAGNPVQGDGGEINIPPGTTNISVGVDGTVSTPQGTLGRVRLVRFENEQALVREGTNYYSAPEGVAAEEVENPRVMQGMVEQSNVNGVNEMTQMVEIMRQYQSAQNIIQSEHERLQNAFRTIGRLA